MSQEREVYMYEFLPMVNPEMTGKRIREFRIGNTFTQRDLAEYFGCTENAVSRWETGKTVPTVDNLLGLSDLFKVPLEEIICRESAGRDRGEGIESSPLPLYSVVFYDII